MQEHSNCPIHRRPGPFHRPPMTERSILQHQRCQPPLLEQTIRRRVRWSGLDDARNDHSRPLSTSFSHFLLFMFPPVWSRPEVRFCHSHHNSPFWALFFPTCRCAAVTAGPGNSSGTDKPHLRLREKEEVEEEGGGHVDESPC